MYAFRQLFPAWRHALLCLALLCCYPLAQQMPADWSWENGIIENTQVAVLSIGLVFALWAWHRPGPARVAMLARCAVPIWALLVGRELSWGAVFLPPSGLGEDGPWYSARYLWFHPYVKPVLFALLSWSAWSAWRARLDRILLDMVVKKQCPWAALVALLGAAVCSTCAEQPGVSDLVPQNAQGFEELAELVGYVALVLVQGHVIAACRAVRSADEASVGSVRADVRG